MLASCHVTQFHGFSDMEWKTTIEIRDPQSLNTRLTVEPVPNRTASRGTQPFIGHTVHRASTTSTKLKTHLFRQAYNTAWFLWEQFVEECNSVTVTILESRYTYSVRRKKTPLNKYHYFPYSSKFSEFFRVYSRHNLPLLLQILLSHLSLFRSSTALNIKDDFFQLRRQINQDYNQLSGIF